MRKRRLTKITVKTREIILIMNQSKDSDCPFCHQPLSVLIPADESSAAPPHTGECPAELSPAETSGDRRKLKGDL